MEEGFSKSTRARITANIGSYHEWKGFLAVCHGANIGKVEQHMECLKIDINYANNFNSEDSKFMLRKLFADMENFNMYPAVECESKWQTTLEHGTALTNMIIRGNKEVVELLMNHPNIDVNIQTIFGLTPLMISMIYSHIVNNIVTGRYIFVEIGIYGFIDRNFQLEKDEDVKFNALADIQMQIFQLLLNCPKSDINFQDHGGLTVLMVACQLNDEVFIDALLARSDVDVNIKDNKGRTALAIAVNNEELGLIKLLLSCSGIIIDEDVVIHYIVAMQTVVINKSQIEIAKLLIIHNSFDVNACNADGLTALHVAAFRNNHIITKFLISRGAIIDDVTLSAPSLQMWINLKLWRDYLPSLKYNRCKNMKFYPKKVKKIGFEWLLTANRLKIPKDISFLLLGYIGLVSLYLIQVTVLQGVVEPNGATEPMFLLGGLFGLYGCK